MTAAVHRTAAERLRVEAENMSDHLLAAVNVAASRRERGPDASEAYQPIIPTGSTSTCEEVVPESTRDLLLISEVFGPT